MAASNWTSVALRRWIRWTVLAFLLNTLWELAQLPLYSLWQDSDRSRIAWHVVHCIAGDVLIASILFMLVAAVLKSPDWPNGSPWRGGALFIGLGVAYTAFSEWHNVYQVQAWSYAPEMPLIGGIGLAPLMQWLLVPILVAIIFRRWR